MTIRELYLWSKERGYEDADIRIDDGTAECVKRGFDIPYVDWWTDCYGHRFVKLQGIRRRQPFSGFQKIGGDDGTDGKGQT